MPCGVSTPWKSAWRQQKPIRLTLCERQAPFLPPIPIRSLPPKARIQPANLDYAQRLLHPVVENVGDASSTIGEFSPGPAGGNVRQNDAPGVAHSPFQDGASPTTVAAAGLIQRKSIPM